MEEILYYTEKNEPIKNTVNLEKEIVLKNLSEDAEFSITVVDVTGKSTTTKFFGGRPNDRK